MLRVAGALLFVVANLAVAALMSYAVPLVYVAVIYAAVSAYSMLTFVSARVSGQTAQLCGQQATVTAFLIGGLIAEILIGG